MSWLRHFIGIHSVLKYAGMFTTVADMREALSLVMRFRIKSEIIGHWLYCFANPLIGFQLELSGFWYSFKHGAWIFSGTEKEFIADIETLDEIRSRLGSFKVKEEYYV